MCGITAYIGSREPIPILLKGLKRLEYRVPDPSSNPYLVFSAVLSAGLDGMKKKTDPGDPIHEDIYKMSKSERKNAVLEYCLPIWVWL